MRVVLDTNVLVSGIFWKGAPYSILTAWARGRFEVVISKDILHEYLAVLKRIDTGGDSAEQWGVFILENAHVVQGSSMVKLSRDSADDKFINTAIIGRADYIVSGDDDLLSLKEKSPVTVVSPRKFAAMLGKTG